MAHSSIHSLRRMLIPIGLLLVMLFAGSSIAVGGSTVSTTAIAPHIPGVTPLLSYQGRLVDPATGAPKANGTYEMSFRLYTLWQATARLCGRRLGMSRSAMGCSVCFWVKSPA